MNLVDQIGEWNPQFFREIKGRLKPFNIIVVVTISLFSQLILFLYQLREFPGDEYPLTANYCNLRSFYDKQRKELSGKVNNLYSYLDAAQREKKLDTAKIKDLQENIDVAQSKLSNFEKFLDKNFCPLDKINMQDWWQDHWGYIFLTISVVLIFVLLVGGTYLLISNLAQEERQGTLNFLRMTPQPEGSILIGKMLGVPILIYLTVLLAIPLHLWSGNSAKIATGNISSFYIILGASCIFFYSAAILFALVSRWLGGFQPWLGSGAVLFGLLIAWQLAAYSSPSFNYTASWLRLLTPLDITSYLFPKLFNRDYAGQITKLQFFHLPIGKSQITLIGIHLLNYGLLNYWIWQGIKRCFRNPNIAVFTKVQSFFIVGCFQIVFWGFTLQYSKNSGYPYDNKISYYDINRQILDNLPIIVFFNLILLFALFAILTPHRQAVQDWERYRHQNSSGRKLFANNPLLTELIWGEKSPALLAIAINLLIAAAPIVIWIILAPALNFRPSNSTYWMNNLGRMGGILTVVMCICLMLIYATLTQWILLMKSSRRTLWAIATVAAVVILPPIILYMLGVYPHKHQLVWLLTTFSFFSLEKPSTSAMFFVFLAQFTVLVLFNFQLARKIKVLGESATKAPTP